MHLKSSSLKRVAVRGLVSIACLTCVSAQAITVKVTVENVGAAGGLWFTPVFFGFHDGSFDTFDAGSAASASIENIAEEGNPSGLVSDISGVAGAKSHVLTQDASGMPPGVLFAPGESNSFTIDLDAGLNRYLSFASMLLPSNDAFFGNDAADAYELFDMGGNFTGGLDINLFGSNIWDAGTEDNNFLGQPFSGPGSIDTIGGTVALLGQAGLDAFAGAGVPPAMSNLGPINANDQFARISVRQVPDSTQYIGFIGAIALIGFRFATKKRMGRD